MTWSSSELSLSSSSSAASMSTSAENCKERRMETLIGGIVALLLFIYLLVAILRPEKF